MSLQQGLHAALLLAFGGVIPEIIYGYLAVEGVMIFEQYPIVFNVMQWIVVPILLGLGVQQIRASQNPKPVINPSKKNQTVSKGFFISMTNPQLLPYWIVILINYQVYSFLRITEVSDKIAFVLGASTGAFALNYVYAYVAFKQRERIFNHLNENRFEQLVGWAFVLMSLLQTLKLIN